MSYAMARSEKPQVARASQLCTDGYLRYMICRLEMLRSITGTILADITPADHMQAVGLRIVLFTSAEIIPT